MVYAALSISFLERETLIPEPVYDVIAVVDGVESIDVGVHVPSEIDKEPKLAIKGDEES